MSKLSEIVRTTWKGFWIYAAVISVLFFIVVVYAAIVYHPPVSGEIAILLPFLILFPLHTVTSMFQNPAPFFDPLIVLIVSYIAGRIHLHWRKIQA